MTDIAMENPLEMEVLMAKSSINGSFSMVMSNNEMVDTRNLQRSLVKFMGFDAPSLAFHQLLFPKHRAKDLKQGPRVEQRKTCLRVYG